MLVRKRRINRARLTPFAECCKNRKTMQMEKSHWRNRTVRHGAACEPENQVSASDRSTLPKRHQQKQAQNCNGLVMNRPDLDALSFEVFRYQIKVDLSTFRYQIRYHSDEQPEGSVTVKLPQNLFFQDLPNIRTNRLRTGTNSTQNDRRQA